MDKGLDFYETRVKATLLTLGLDENRIFNLINQAKIKYSIAGSMERLKIIITSDKRPKKIEEEKFGYSKKEDEVYDNYSRKNILLLNEMLEGSRNGDFSKIQFAEGKPEEMHRQIVELIGDEIKSATQYEKYPIILESAKRIFTNNLRFLCVAGSAGKGNFIRGWSDIDVYVIVKSFDGDQFSEFLSEMEGNNIHIGITCYTKKELEKDSISNRARAMFYELGKGKNIILYKDNTFIEPKYTIEQIKNNDKNDYASTNHNLRRLVYSKDYTNRTNVSDDKDNITKIIKNTILLEKLIIKDKLGIPTSGYYDTSTVFAKYIYHKYRQEEDKRGLIESISLTDYIKQIKNRDDENVKTYIIQYAKNIMKAANLLIENDEQRDNNAYEIEL